MAGKKGGNRKPDDLSGLKYTVDQIRLKLHRMTGVTRAPWWGRPKSTTFVNSDVAILAKIERERISNFKLNNGYDPRLGKKRLQRIIDVLDLIESGCITKVQKGVYVYHDKPVAPVREMSVSLTGGTILKGAKSPEAPKKMPDFKKLFG